MSAEWHYAHDGQVPYNAVEGGNDVNGEPIYVGRAHESGDVIPGKIVPSHGCCYVPYGGREISHDSYEYLVRPEYGHIEWRRAYDGLIPDGGLPAGHTSEGEPLFVGRAYHEGSWVVGKVQRSHGVLYVPFGGDEIPIHDYELLCIVY